MAKIFERRKNLYFVRAIELSGAAFAISSICRSQRTDRNAEIESGRLITPPLDGNRSYAGATEGKCYRLGINAPPAA